MWKKFFIAQLFGGTGSGVGGCCLGLPWAFPDAPGCRPTRQHNGTVLQAFWTIDPGSRPTLCTRRIHIDNSAFQRSAVKGWSLAHRLQRLCRSLFEIALEFECVFEFKWLASAVNKHADLLRLHSVQLISCFVSGRSLFRQRYSRFFSLDSTEMGGRAWGRGIC